MLLSRARRKFCRPPAACTLAALKPMPISLAAFVASELGLMSEFSTADSWVATSEVLPVTPVVVANTAISSSIDTPSCDALPLTMGNACPSCSKLVTPFFAVICILSWMAPAWSQLRP